uniref:Uncharacterized protein n=1 Tax=Oryza meridionalis TaxID=40149 RepID=A0A0E0EHW2_9ORYZ
MSGGGGGRKAADTGGEEAEVEALLRAAQDAVMLKLQANSHLVSSSSSATAPNLPPSLDHPAAAADPLDADLARRFNALRSPRPPDPKPKQPDAPSAAAAAGGMDELEARFAALKGAAGPEKETRVRLEDLGGESDEDDEVDKVMRWAMDAARLDVATAGAGKAKSAKKDDDEEEEKDEKSSSVSSEDDDEEEEEEKLEERERKRKEMMSKNKSKTKWFSLF